MPTRTVTAHIVVRLVPPQPPRPSLPPRLKTGQVPRVCRVFRYVVAWAVLLKCSHFWGNCRGSITILYVIVIIIITVISLCDTHAWWWRPPIVVSRLSDHCSASFCHRSRVLRDNSFSDQHCWKYDFG